MNIRCSLCENLARFYNGSLEVRFCSEHAKPYPWMHKIPFVTDLGMLRCLRCQGEWIPETFLLKPREKNPSKKNRALRDYMQIQKECPFCRSPRWFLERVRGVPDFRTKKRAPWRRLLEQSSTPLK